LKLDAADLKKRIVPLFQENFTHFGELGAAVSVWQNGKTVVDLYGGFRDARREHRWASDTIVLVWSATKGLGSACVLHVLQENKIDINEPVAEFWPEFAQAGKEKITLAELLSHQGGLCALDRRVDMLDYGPVIRALEEQRPLWPPGPGMVIMPVRSAFFSMNLSAVSLRNLCRSTGERFLATLSNSICGSVCQKKRIPEWRRCMPQKPVNRRNRNNFTSI